jgi:hypothetical protein
MAWRGVVTRKVLSYVELRTRFESRPLRRAFTAPSAPCWICLRASMSALARPSWADAIDVDLDDGRLRERFRPEARAVPSIAVDLVPLSASDELAAVCSSRAQTLEVVGLSMCRGRSSVAARPTYPNSLEHPGTLR